MAESLIGAARPTVAEIDLEAVRHNIGELRRASSTDVCAVVKADGYGHGAVPVAVAALEAGAAWLAVALVEEGVALRSAGITAPVLVLSEPHPAAAPLVVANDLRPTLYTAAGIAAMAAAAGGAPAPIRSPATPLAVHVKVDTGMHRVGAQPEAVVDLVRQVEHSPSLRFEGLWTHLATADEADPAFTDEQLRRFEAVRASLAEAGFRPGLLHASNSAGALHHPDARYDLVRCGIAIYGCAPAPGRPMDADLRPVMSLRSKVSLVKRVAAGEAVSYGQRHRFDRDTIVATVPIGYADGVPRRLSAVGGEVLIGGRRRLIAGTITMDQILVACDEDGSVAIGDDVVLLGRQGHEVITADDWAWPLDTISYEIVCGISGRVPRVYR